MEEKQEYLITPEAVFEVDTQVLYAQGYEQALDMAAKKLEETGVVRGGHQGKDCQTCSNWLGYPDSGRSHDSSVGRLHHQGCQGGDLPLQA